MPPVALRPRSTLEIIDAAVQLLRQHYGELVTVTGLFMIPVIIARMFLAPQAAILTPAVSMGSMSGLAGFGLVSFVLNSMSTAAVVVIVSDSYLGREVTVGAAINRVLERFWTVLGVVFLQGLIIALGILLLIIPALIFGAWFFAGTNVVMVEGKGVIEALSRSRNLARGSVGRILGTLAMAGIIVWLLDVLVSAIAVALFMRLGSGVVAANLAPYVLGIFITPFLNVVVTLLYYDLRIRKEAFDLELMAKELGFAVPAAAVSH